MKKNHYFIVFVVTSLALVVSALLNRLDLFTLFVGVLIIYEGIRTITKYSKYKTLVETQEKTEKIMNIWEYFVEIFLR